MNKIVINIYCSDEFSKFGLSTKAVDWLIDHGIRSKYPKIRNLNYLPRHEPLLVECVETLGKAASSAYCLLRVVEINDDSYLICMDDGYETVITSKDLIKIK